MKKLLVALVAMSVVVAQAAVININAYSTANGSTPNATMNGTASGATAGPAAYTGTLWNDLDQTNLGGTSAALTDSDGVLTSVTLSNTHGVWEHWSAAQALTAVQGYWYHNAAGRSYTLDGLGAATQWDIYIISNGNNTDQGGIWTIGADTQTSTSYGTDLSQGAFVEGANYVRFASVVADGAGSVAISVAAINGAGPVMNGMQLVQVPEPATLGLLGVFGGAMLFIRRKFAI